MTLVYIGIALAVVFAVLAIFGKSYVQAPPENLTDEDIRNIAMQGQKIQAIKWYRSLHGVGLKEAKDAVEEMTRKV